MQLGVFGFCGYEDGDIGVGVFPECEEIVVGGTSLRCVALKGIGAGKTEVREGSRFTRPYNPSMVENFLKLGSSSGALVRRQKCLCLEMVWPTNEAKSAIWRTS
jgi:hypothetical protein